MPIDFIGYMYAATVAAGGVLGYVKSQSIPSLGAGLLFGSVLGYGAYQTSRDPTNIKVTLTTSVILCGIMGYRFHITGKLMPAGIIVVYSFAMCLRSGLNYFGESSMKVE